MKTFSWLALIALVLITGGFVFLHLSPSYNTYLVRGNSMRPTLNTGDMIINGPLNGPSNGEIRAGTIVTYQQGKGLVTHRVLSMNGDTIVTKGDAAEDPDLWLVTLSDVRGIYLFKIPYVGYVTNFARTKLGWFLVSTLPATLLVALLVKDRVKKALNRTRNTEPKY